MAHTEYALTVAATAAEVYGQTNEALGQSALLGAEMMDYRDEHSRAQLTAADWEHIATGLQQAYEELKEAMGH